MSFYWKEQELYLSSVVWFDQKTSKSANIYEKPLSSSVQIRLTCIPSRYLMSSRFSFWKLMVSSASDKKSTTQNTKLKTSIQTNTKICLSIEVLCWLDKTFKELILFIEAPHNTCAVHMKPKLKGCNVSLYMAMNFSCSHCWVHHTQINSCKSVYIICTEYA